MKNILLISEDEKRLILNKHISYGYNTFINEQVVTNYDKVYDYKREGNNFYVKKKGNDKWIQLSGNPLNAVKTKVFKISSNDSNKKFNTDLSGFIIIFAFPEYKPSLEKGDAFSEMYAKVIKTFTGNKPEKFPPVGHGGCIIINKNGNAILYEFGRYQGHKANKGIVLSRNLGKIAKISEGNLINVEDVAKIAKKYTQGNGKNLTMTGVLYKLPNPQNAISYASVKERDYEITDMDVDDEEANCGTFALKVAKAGGVKVPEYCFPMPAYMIQQLRVNVFNIPLEYFSV